ncbi:MAG TPA: DMT family transporter [Methyloceanibacter sp.]|nr:DMT family transporter [Methyloceanibacter sp.]
MTLLGLLLTLFALGAGALISLQAPINAEAAARLGNPIAASTLSFCVGTVALIAITLLLRQDVNFSALKTMPLYVLLSGGLLGAMYVTANLMLAPRIGVAALIALGIAGQLVAALLLDRYGLFDLVARELSIGRIGGTLMVIAGAVMVRYL